jgi:sorting nexin-29
MSVMMMSARKPQTKNQAYRDMIQRHYTRNAEETYKELRKQEKHIHKKKIRIYYEEQLKETESLNSQNETRKFYQLVNNVRKEFKSRITCRKENEEMSDKKEISDRWNQYFKKVLEGNEDGQPLETNTVDAPEGINNDEVEKEVPTKEEVKLAIKKLKNSRSPGSDNLNFELLKVDEPELTDKLHRVMSKVWTTEKIPTEWEEGSIYPTYKKGDQLECHDYRGITLLNTAYKIFSHTLYERLLPYIYKIVGNYQGGYRTATTDQIYALRQILEKTREYNISTFHLFIDFKAVYDSIRKDKLFMAMEEFEISRKLINLTKIMLMRVRCIVKIQNTLSEPFTTERGLRQGDALVCMLFHTALRKAIRQSGTERRGTIYHKSIQVLAYTDDIDIIGRTMRAVKEAFVNLESAAKEMSLSINESKSKYMEVTNNPTNTQYLSLKEYKFEKVTQF